MKIRFLSAFVVSAFILLALPLAVFRQPGIVVGAILLAIVVYVHCAESRKRGLTDLALLTIVPVFFGMGVLFVVRDPLALILTPVLLALLVYALSTASKGRTLRNVALATIGALLADALMLPAFPGAGASARRAQCVNNLKMIGVALHNYQDEHGRMPPIRECDSAGKPLHSWRVLLLPYLECGKSPREQYNFGEPWNGPNNAKLASKKPPDFWCPSNPIDGPREITNYVAVVGPDDTWLGAPAREDQRNPVWIVESHDSAVRWMEPRDISLDAACQGASTRQTPGLSSEHPMGANALFADGTVRFVPSNVPSDVLRAAFLGDREKQETLAVYANAPQPVDWPWWTSLTGLVAWFTLMLAWPRKKRDVGAGTSSKPPTAVPETPAAIRE